MLISFFFSYSENSFVVFFPSLSHMRWVSVARAARVDAFPVSVPHRQALAECVARSRFVGLYGGVLLGKVASPESSWLMAGSAAVGLTRLIGSSGERG